MTAIALRHPRVTTLAMTTVLCLAIAGLLAYIGTGGGFWTNLVVSLCIGYSIYATSALASPWLEGRLPPFVGEAMTVAAGLALGLALAGAAVTGSPGFFFVEDTGTVLIGIFFGVIGTIVFSSLQHVADMRHRLERAEVVRLVQEKQLLETELKLLQAQIEPHFLFNTLSNVIGLVGREPDAARRTLEHLTTLLRASLGRTRSRTVTLGEEIELVRAYLEIQRIRMGDRLEFEFLGLEPYRSVRFPPLLLQPLVENAVRHGIDPAAEGGRIVISATTAGSDLVLSVSDDGVGPGAAAAGSGTGLANVRDRLRGLYGARATLTVSGNRPRGLIATIRLPRDPVP